MSEPKASESAGEEEVRCCRVGLKGAAAVREGADRQAPQASERSERAEEHSGRTDRTAAGAFGIVVAPTLKATDPNTIDPPGSTTLDPPHDSRPTDHP